jgi:hypothetical protein
MKKIFLLSLIAFILSSGAAAQKFKRLFNGHDLSGWKINGTEKWYVKNGELIAESGPDKEYGYLTTEKPLQKFRTHS